MASPFKPRHGTSPFRVDILILPQFSLMSLASTMEPLRAANRVADQTLYEWRLLSLDGAPVMSTSSIPIGGTAGFDDTDSPDALIVIASMDDRRAEKKIHASLRRLARRRVPLGAVEAASWTFAAAGLLSGKRATTHWEDLAFFAESFPDVAVVPDRFVIDGLVFTTGGATPALDMMLELISAQHGIALAMNAASLFVYDQQRHATDPQPAVSVGRLALTHPKIATAIRQMEQNISSPLRIPDIAQHVNLSVRSMETQFKATLGLSPQAYYLDMRLNAVRRLMLQSSLNVAEIADVTGFTSASACARAFRRRYAQSPSELRRNARNLSA